MRSDVPTLLEDPNPNIRRVTLTALFSILDDKSPLCPTFYHNIYNHDNLTRWDAYDLVGSLGGSGESIVPDFMQF